MRTERRVEGKDEEGDKGREERVRLRMLCGDEVVEEELRGGLERRGERG